MAARRQANGSHDGLSGLVHGGSPRRGLSGARRAGRALEQCASDAERRRQRLPQASGPERHAELPRALHRRRVPNPCQDALHVDARAGRGARRPGETTDARRSADVEADAAASPVRKSSHAHPAVLALSVADVPAVTPAPATERKCSWPQRPRLACMSSVAQASTMPDAHAYTPSTQSMPSGPGSHGLPLLAAELTYFCYPRCASCVFSFVPHALPALLASSRGVLCAR